MKRNLQLKIFALTNSLQFQLTSIGFYFTKQLLSRSVYQNIGFALRVAKQEGASSVKRNVNSRVSYIQVPWRDAVQNHEGSIRNTIVSKRKKKDRLKKVSRYSLIAKQNSNFFPSIL